MGWKNSPPFFCAITETVADVTNERIHRHHRPPQHRMDRIADTPPEITEFRSTDTGLVVNRSGVTAVPTPPPLDPTSIPSTYPNRPVGQFDIYVDDFLGLAQGGARTRNRLRRVLFHTLDEVLRPKDAADPEANQEPISVKNSAKVTQNGPPPSRCWDS
jgi:hypothetical protein